MVGLLGLKELQRNTRYDIIGGNLISSPDNKTTYITKGYQANDIIYSIVNLVTEKVRVCPWGVYKVEDESSLKSYRAIISKKDWQGDDFSKAMKFRKKALVPYNDTRLEELLKYPNEYCTFSSLVADSSIFKMITGGRMLWADTLGEGANGAFPQGLYHLPYDLITIIASRTFPIKEVGYRIDGWGITQANLTLESVLHDKYFNPKLDLQGKHLFGQSPLKAGLARMDMSNESTTTATSMFQNQGPRVIVYTDSEKFTIDEQGNQAAQIKKILTSKEYSGSENSGKVASAGIKMGVAQVGLSPVDLGIVQLQEWQLRWFCNLFGAVPSQVLNDPQNKTYNNSQEGERALTTRGALPLINSFRDSFNQKLQVWGYKGKNVYVDADLTVYSELQDNLKDKWTWVRELPVSWKYKLELMGLDYEEDETGLDEVMIPTGFQNIDSMNVVDNVFNNDYTANGNGQISNNGK